LPDGRRLADRSGGYGVGRLVAPWALSGARPPGAYQQAARADSCDGIRLKLSSDTGDFIVPAHGIPV